MPQFDIFSFSTQLFWTFLGFSLLCFSLNYYLLPAISITLKLRRKKLAASSAKDSTIIKADNFENALLSNGSDLLWFNSKNIISTKDMQLTTLLPYFSNTQLSHINSNNFDNLLIKKQNNKLVSGIYLKNYSAIFANLSQR